MTEEMIARMEAERPPKMLDIMLSVMDHAGKRHPMHVQIHASAAWDDLVQSRHQQAGLQNLPEHAKFPSVAAAYYFEWMVSRLSKSLAMSKY
jgi:hypothetical protein